MKKRQIIGISIWGAISLAIIGVLIYLNIFAAQYHPYLNDYYGAVGSGYENIGEVMRYVGDYKTEGEVLDAFRELNSDIIEEGTVMLKNDNDALPLKKNDAVSVFGMSSVLWFEHDKILSTKESVFADKLEDAGLKMNSELRKMYKQSTHTNWGVGDNKGDGSAAGTWKIDEVPQSEYSAAVKNSYPSYADAAIVVLSRSAGEGADLPRSMDRFGGGVSQSYLELSSDEKDLFQAIENANCFKKIVVVLHTSNPMQMDFLSSYKKIDSVLWVAGTGTDGINGLVNVIMGEASPSGRLVDTFTYDNFSAPAMQNMGDFRYVDASGQLIKDSALGNTSYSYINYAENIYVGYRYYETRYEDKVTKRANAGSFDYGATVAAPFGHGLSYGKFEWRNMGSTYDSETDTFELTAVVENKGDIPAKEVVQFYVQKPYNGNGIETSAVELCGFGKTEELEKNKSQRITVKVDGSQLCSYDAVGAKTYVLDAGDYYFTAAKNAHSAVNNILAAKKYTTADGMDAAGDENMVKQHKVSAADIDKYSTAATDTKITNQFDNALMGGASYLSRSNWSVLDSWSRDWTKANSGGITSANGVMTGVSNNTESTKTAKTAVVKDDTLAVLTEKNGWKASGNPNDINSYPAITTNADNGLELVHAVDKDFDDETWDKLLDMLSVDEMHRMYRQGSYSTIALDKIKKPSTRDADGPAGVANSTFGIAQIMIASTWSQELATAFGSINGDYALLEKVHANGWYAPGMNIHRTPFSGRNYEYFAEDSFLVGHMGKSIVIAARAKGLNPVLKHFALNDQETNRAAYGYIATYAQEQAIREIYLRPFEICVIKGSAVGIMSAMNRIGNIFAPAHYKLNINVLRGEWGYKGMIITDYVKIDPYYSLACIAGGATLQLSSAPNSIPEAELQTTGVQNMLRNATHGTLYFVANGSALNGFVPGTRFNEGLAVYIILLIIIDTIVLAILTCGILLQLYNYRVKNRNETDGAVLKRKKILNIVYWSVTGAIIAAALIIFFSYALPLLLYAFNIS